MRRTLLAVLILFAATDIQAQQAARRPLNHGDYDNFRAIQGQRLTRDGKFLAYTLVPQDADGEFVLRNLTTGKDSRYGIGWRPTTPAPVDEETGAPAPNNGPPPAFTSDGRFVVFQIQPNKASVDSAKKARKRADDMPKNGIGIMTVATGSVTRVDRVKSFQVADDNPAWVAWLLEAKPAADSSRRSRGRATYGTDLVLKSLNDQSEKTFPDVTEYSLSRDGKSLVYAVSSRNDETNGVYQFTPASTAPAAMISGKGKYTKLTWDDRQAELAFLGDQGDSAQSRPNYRLYRWDRTAPKAEELVSPQTTGFARGMIISERGAIDFSRDGEQLFFGVAPPPEADPDTSAAADDKVSFDLWNWRDDFIQPMQKVRAAQERNRSYRAVFHIPNHTLVQLADTTMQNVIVSDNGDWAVGQDDRPYRKLVGVEGSNLVDQYAINTKDGSRTAIMLGQRGNIIVSPSGKTALYFRDKDWYLAALADGKSINLTKNLGVPFYQEDFDSPSDLPSWGTAGWTRDEKYVLLNDRYDIWQVNTDGSGGTNLTDGFGRKNKTILRYVRLDPAVPGEPRGVDQTKPLYLSAVNEWTREEGVYRDRVDGNAAPEKLLWANRAFGGYAKARDADVVIYTQQGFNEFPDYWVTNSDFKLGKKVTDANPQKSGMAWGTSELVRFKNVDGVQLSGILMKPDNFDPNKKYPMIVYLYEKLSQNVNQFVVPRPTNSINASYYVSNGYLVFEPDIVYNIGYPGPSALKCVLPGVQAVVDKGFVDEANIGIQGHSWGGYQIAYMITQTNRFKAAAPGAVVVNMTSAYSGIRWGSGLPRQFQYEHTQSRIGGSIWEYPMRFMENSALFQLDRVQTPVMTIANDADDAVPWYQGIEFYLGLRRLGKEVYLFSYNGEPHNLRKRQNQKDYTRRLAEYFDHFLKGAPEPDWMTRGIPFLQKDKVNVTSDRMTP